MIAMGEALDWRAQLRAEDIQRRSGRPDRGYVDQSPPPTPRAPSVIPLARLEEAQAVSALDMHQSFDDNDAGEQPLPSAPPPPPPPPVLGDKPPPAAPPLRRVIVRTEDLIRTQMAPKPAPPPPDREARSIRLPGASLASVLGLIAKEPEPEEPEEEEEMEEEEPERIAAPRKGAPMARRHKPNKGRRTFSPEFRLDVVRRVLMEEENAGPRSGAQKRIADQAGIHQTVASQWVKAWKERNPGRRWPGDDGKPVAPKPAEKTVASSGNGTSERERARALLGEASERTIEQVSRELQAAITSVKVLKAELKALLD